MTARTMGSPFGRPQDGDVVAGAVAAGSGLVADLPVVGDPGADQLVAGHVALHHLDDDLALVLARGG